MNEREELEALRRLAELEAKAKGIETPAAQAPRNILQRTGDEAAGLLRGAGSIGATLMAPKDYLEDFFQQRLTGQPTGVSRNTQRREDMTKALETMGADTKSTAFKVGKFGGEALGVAGAPVYRGGGLLLDAGKNAISGGAAAAAINPEDAAMGAEVGAGLTLLGRPVAAAGKWVGENFLSPAWDLMRKGGEQNIVKNYLTRLIGEQNVPATVQAARTSTGFTPGYQPKTVETMVKYGKNPVTGKNELTFMPEASPLSKITQTEASQPGGASAQFGKVMAAQDRAIQAAEKARDAAAAPMRETAIRSANMAGGVDITPVAQKIAQMRSTPANYGASGVDDVLSAIKSDLDRIIKKSGGRMVDADAIYSFRKDLGKTISSIAESKKITFDKGMSAKLADDIQNVVDDEINAAIRASGMKDVAPGVTVYDRYMNNFAKASDDIRLTQKARELAAKPPQPTNIPGGRDVAGEATPQTANVLSRPVMMTNWTLRLFGKNKEPMVDELLTKVLLNPSEYEKLMRGVNPATRAQVKIAMDLMRNSAIAGIASE